MHQALLSHGARNYPWDQFWRDYRLAVAFYLFDPPRLLRMGAPTDLWWSILEHTLTAYRELECEEAVQQLA